MATPASSRLGRVIEMLEADVLDNALARADGGELALTGGRRPAREMIKALLDVGTS